MTEFILNNQTIKTDLAPGMVMLDFIRYHENLKGTKIGCREGDCGACTVLVGELKEDKVSYKSMTSCLMPVGNAAGKHIVTVEGINLKELSPVQQAIVEEGGTQCGFCTVGFVMSLTGFCLDKNSATSENAIAAMDGNICRCTGYKSLERAATTLAKQLSARDNKNTLQWLVDQQFIPSYFTNIPKRLAALTRHQSEQTPSINTGGGTDLYVQRHDSMTSASINFLLDESSLKNIEQKGNKIHLGASVTVEDIRKSDLMNTLFPQLQKYLKLVSSTPIRNMATIAGNFVNASPIGDMTIFFLALNAEITLKQDQQTRTIYLKDFYKGYKTLDKKENEIISEIIFDAPDTNFHFNFEKVSKRTNLDIASANGAISFRLNNNKIENANVSAGGVFAYPLYLHKTSAYLSGKILNDETIRSAAEILTEEIKPISDARGAAAYKTLLSRQLFFAHFIELFPDTIQPENLLLKGIA